MTDSENPLIRIASRLESLLGLSGEGIDAIIQSFPEMATLSFAEALADLDGDQRAKAADSIRRLRAAASLARTPILAVTGMLNSGKTSLVASMLSESGTARALRGEANSEGTHRFVLWLPEAWRGDPETFGLLKAQLDDAFGAACEELADDPAAAHQQYNNADDDAGKLGVPLLATDPQLNDLNVGLLDCPDIVTAAAHGKGDARLRRELLKAAAPICSAFVVVSAMHSARDETLDQILEMAAQLMPGVPRYLAINLIRPRYSPGEVASDLQPIATRHHIASLYVAYDYELADSAERIPTSAQFDGTRPHPVFFVPDESDANNEPATIERSRLFSQLPSQLDRSALYDRFARALAYACANDLSASREAINGKIETAVTQAEAARKRLLDTALELFAVRAADGSISELRLHQSRQIVQQLNDAFIRAAPWYARLGMTFQGVLHRLGSSAQDAARRLLPSAAAVEKAEEVKQQFVSGRKGSILTPVALASMLRRTGATETIGVTLDEETLKERATEILRRFEEEDVTRLDTQRLEAAASQMWREVSVGQKLKAGLTPLAAVVAVFGGVLMLPLDFGGTAVVAAASIKELLAAAGLAAFATWWSGQQAHHSITESAAIHQLANLVSIMCDAFGLPREMIDGTPLSLTFQGRSRQLPHSEIAERPQHPVAVKLWQWNGEFESQFDATLQQLKG